jgi:hypothetical protein
MKILCCCSGKNNLSEVLEGKSAENSSTPELSLGDFD